MACACGWQHKTATQKDKASILRRSRFATNEVLNFYCPNEFCVCVVEKETP